MAAFVNSSSAQHFSGSSFTSMVTPAYILTAGNLSIVVGRNLTSDLTAADVTITDTAGNTYQLDGAIGPDHGMGFLVWSCRNCLGHASNVVTVTYPSRAFTAVTAMQFSGAPASIGLDFIGTYVASGASVSCLPSSAYSDQIVIVGSDVANSRGTTTIAPSATFTHVYGSSADGHPTGTGSHDVWYNLNATRLFHGFVTVTATYDNQFGNFANAKTIFAAIYSPATANNCSSGGQIDVEADPADGADTFAGRSPRARAWLALGFGSASAESTGYFAPDSANHPPAFYGGRKRGILKQIGRITRRLSDRFSSYKMGGATVEVDDAGRFFSQVENGSAMFGANTGEFWQNRDGRIYLASPETIAASGTPHTLFRGIWRTHESAGLSRSLSLVDILGSEFSDFNLEEQHPRRKVKDIFDNAAGLALEAATSDDALLEAVKAANALAKANRDKPQPIAYGALSDKSATATATPPITATFADVKAALDASFAGGTIEADWAFIIGIYDSRVLQGGGIPDNDQSLVSIIGGGDYQMMLQNLSTAGGLVITDTGKGKIAPRYVGYYTCADSVVRHAWIVADSAINHIEGRYLDGVSFHPDDHGYHDPESSDWTTVSGTSNTFMVIGGQTVTMLFIDQGAFANAIVGGQTILTLNLCGREDVGNATGNTIVSAPRVIFHLLNQSIFRNYTAGTWAAPASSTDGVPWVNSQSFEECEDIEVVRIGGEGYRLDIYLDEALSLRELLGRLQMNTDLRFGQNKHGQVIARHLDDQLDLTTLESITDTHDLIAPTKFSRKLDELENAVDYDWNYRPADGTFEEPDHGFTNPVAITANRDRVAKLDRRELFYVLHQGTADDVAARGLSNGSGYVPRYATFTCNLNVLTRVELGDVVLVTDVDDQGATGQVARPYWVLGIDTTVGMLDEPPVVELFCQDVTRFFGTIGVWGPGTLVNWSAEDQDDRRTYFFFANDSGLFNDGAAAKEWR